MKKHLFTIAGLFIMSLLSAQITLLNEDFGTQESAGIHLAATDYALDPVASYLDTDTVTINFYGADKPSTGKYEGASGENFFLLTNNWSDPNTVLTWAYMDVSSYSELTYVKFGCSFGGGANDGWVAGWLFSMQYSTDDVVADPDNAIWNNIDLSGATGWPDPQTAGGTVWSYVTVPVSGVNLNGVDKLSFRIKSNAAADYHIDDLKLEVKTPTSGQERTTIAKETFGSGYFRGPANTYEGYSNGGTMTFSKDTAHYQNYGNTFTNTYEGNSNDGNWWITDTENNEGTLVFTVNTEDYADVNIQFGFTYWGGVPGSMLGVSYTIDSTEWFPVSTVDPATPYPGTNEKTLNDGYFNLIRYSQILPRASKLTIKIEQLTPAQAIIDDIELTGVYNPLSDNATLTDITFPDDNTLALDPAFSSEVTAYTCVLPSGTTMPPAVTAATTDPNATVAVEDALDVTSSDATDRTTYITVTASDGTTQQVYSVEFYVPGNDATLSGITFPGNGGLALDPAFSSDVTAYTVVLDPGTTATPSITATTSDANATVSVADAADVTSDTPADRTSTITVTAEDGITEVVYTVEFSVSTDGIEGIYGQMQVYPNPVVDNLNLRSERMISNVKIFNNLGKEVKVMKVNQYNCTIDMAAMNHGVYFVQIFMNDGQSGMVKVVR
ncbi:MAG TPA: T9SS type A sorting domain-containing protein [Bacteroidales bacterium]|nr:T9SS type A sorting domain-containing protein [Bacteroidales bacterium]